MDPCLPIHPCPIISAALGCKEALLLVFFPKLLAIAEAGECFLTLLPPREAIESEDAFETQLSYSPKPANVVRLSDVLSDRPSHSRQTLRKALHRLAPTCRLLWSKTLWIAKTIEKVSVLLCHLRAEGFTLALM